MPRLRFVLGLQHDLVLIVRRHKYELSLGLAMLRQPHLLDRFQINRSTYLTSTLRTIRQKLIRGLEPSFLPPSCGVSVCEREWEGGGEQAGAPHAACRVTCGSGDR